MKNKKKFLFAFAAVALLSLAACGQRGNANPYGALPEETNADIIDDLKVVHADEGVYGNVRLPDASNGATISWWSSNPDIINPNAVGDAAPGVVNRPSQDAEVTLTAQIEKNGVKTKYEQVVKVKAAAKQLEDQDFEAYLFGHFVGESYGKTENGVKIATGEQMFFALADVGEGLHFKDMNGSTMNNLKPVLTSNVGERGVRDPFMLRSPEGDSFYLIATDLSIYTRGGWGMDNAGAATKTGSQSICLWESHDLVNWTDCRLIKVAKEEAGMAWAPEMIYNEETGEYLIFFSSTLLDDPSLGKNANIIYRDSVYYTTTRDFVHFGETKQFIPNTTYQEGLQRSESESKALNNDKRKVIDGSVMKIGDYYYSASKDGGNNEAGGGIRISRTQNLYDGEWEFVMNLADAGFKVGPKNNPTEKAANNQCLEGPEWFFYNRADRKDPNVPEIGLMADYYSNTSVGYIPFSTTDIEDTDNSNHSWRKLEDGAEDGYSWDAQTKRHGTILRITAEEAERLKEAYPISK